MSRLEAVLHEALRWVKPAWAALVRAAETLWHRAVSLWSQIRDRHEQLMESDPRYPVALASGGAAVVKVFVTNPAVVKAITVLIADVLGSQDRPTSRPTWQPTTPWTTSQGSSLWDRNEWDEE